MQNVIIYTDGGCSPNPGKGAWAAIILSDREYRLSGIESDSTNNRMETTAVIAALASLKEASNVELHTDSMYVCNAINNREKWLKKPSLINKDLILQLYTQLDKHSVHPNWIRGHNGNEWNEECDKCIKRLLF